VCVCSKQRERITLQFLGDYLACELVLVFGGGVKWSIDVVEIEVEKLVQVVKERLCG
jgi:hypothetical protein